MIDVDEVHADRGVHDAGLTGAGLRHRGLYISQNLRAAEALESNRARHPAASSWNFRRALGIYTPMSAHLVIVGGGQAASQAGQPLRQRGFAGTLTLIGEEP